MNETQGNLALTSAQPVNEQPQTIAPTAQPAQPTQPTQPTQLAPAVPLKIEKPVINLPVFERFEDIQEAIATNLEGEMPRFDKITVPSGGGLSFSTIDDVGQEISVNNFKGVIIGFHKYYVRFTKKFSEKKEGEQSTFCFSENRDFGTGCEEAEIEKGRTCATCPYRQKGSDRDGSQGRDCHERCRLWILKEDTAFPIVLDLPRGSVFNFVQHIGFLTKKVGLPYNAVVTLFGLETETNDKKIKYSKVKFSRENTLSTPERSVVKAMKEQLKNVMTVNFSTIAAEAEIIQEVEPTDDEFTKVADSLTNDQAY
jgi:hypothetical protein